MTSLIMVVDDEPSCFQTIEALLYGEGHALRYVRDSATAFDAIREAQPAIVLTDLMMPKVTGIELCQALKADPKTRDIPVILLTTLDDKRHLARCLEAGADDFLNKQVSAPELKARVRSMLRIRGHYDLLRRAMRLREDFAHVVIHDMGTPLGTITMEADELLACEARPDQLPSLNAIKSNARRLREMAHDLLLLAKIDEGKLQLDSRLHDLTVTIGEAVGNVEALAKRRKIVLRTEHAAPGLSAVFDRALVLRVLDNILGNALKFSPSSGEIDIRSAALVREGRTFARVEVEDTGPGVPLALREKVFERFEIGQIRSDVPQVGLGLSFCRTAIEAHGGKIGIAEGRGSGAIVFFEI